MGGAYAAAVIARRSIMYLANTIYIYAKLADRLPERIKGLVLFNSLVPYELGFHPSEQLPLSAQIAATLLRVPVLREAVVQYLVWRKPQLCCATIIYPKSNSLCFSGDAVS